VAIQPFIRPMHAEPSLAKVASVRSSGHSHVVCKGRSGGVQGHSSVTTYVEHQNRDLRSDDAQCQRAASEASAGTVGLTPATGATYPLDGSCPHCLPLKALVVRCQNERRSFQRHDASDERFAMELLARAVHDGNQLAWAAFIDEFGELVVAHIRCHPAHALVPEDDLFWVNRTFQRFTQAVGPDRLDRFSSLGAVLGYLKMCAHSALMDELRALKRRQELSLEMLADSLDSGTDPEDSTVATLSAEALWRVVMEELIDETDRLIARLSFKHAYKPGEIYTKYPGQFTCITDVYDRKRKIVDRLRRNPSIQSLLGVPGQART
jgi:hypothetical protein